MWGEKLNFFFLFYLRKEGDRGEVEIELYMFLVIFVIILLILWYFLCVIDYRLVLRRLIR